MPGGNATADLLGAILSVVFAIAIALLLARLYREHRVAIFGLGDRHRALLYGALAAGLLAAAAAGRLFDTGAGVALWFVLVGGASYALYAVWRHYRAYE